MLNDALKNDIAPWEVRGRWYHFFIESNGSSSSLTTCDLDNCTVSGSALYMPDGFRCVDYKVLDHDLAVSKSLSDTVIKTASSGKEYFSIPSAADYTYMDGWFFAYKKSE